MYILLEYCRASAPSTFTTFLGVAFLLLFLLMVPCPGEVMVENCRTTIMQGGKLVTSPKGPTPQWRHDHQEGQVSVTIPVKLLPSSICQEFPQWKRAWTVTQNLSWPPLPFYLKRLSEQQVSWAKFSHGSSCLLLLTWQTIMEVTVWILNYRRRGWTGVLQQV